jgi:hypothetical protein
VRKRLYLILDTLKVITLLSILISCAGIPSIKEQEDHAAGALQNEESSEVLISQEKLQIENKKNIFKAENGLELNVSEMEDIAFGFVHTGKFSPDGDVQLIIKKIDHGLSSLAFRTYFKTHSVDDIVVSPRSYAWSSSGKYVVIHNVDYYADDGSTGIIILNVQSGHYIEITSDQLINGKDLGKRDKLNIYNIVWLDSNRFSLIVSAGYLGESGHPGIDYNRKTNLGDNYGNKDDIILVANWVIEIVNDESKSLDPPKIEKSETLKLLLGKWQSMDDTRSYVLFTEKEIIYFYDSEVTSQETYILSNSCMDSEEVNEDNSSDSPQYIYMEIRDTCFYIIDLAPQYLALSHGGRGNTLTYVK